MDKLKASLPRMLFWVHKHLTSGNRPYIRAVTLFNDGKHLYVVGVNGDPWSLLSFSGHSGQFNCSNISGIDFGNQTVMLKTWRHTISGHVVVSLREISNNWMVVVSIGLHQKIEIGDSYRTVTVSIVK